MIIFKDGFDSLQNWFGTILKENKIENLYIGGLATGVCALNTIFSAYTRGLGNIFTIRKLL